MMDRLLDNFRSVSQNSFQIRPGAEGASVSAVGLGGPAKTTLFAGGA
jgi:hypothetical protein